MTIILWILLFLNIAIGVFGQYLLKSVLTEGLYDFLTSPSKLLYAFTEWRILIAVLCYFINLILYLVLLSRLELGFIFALQVSLAIVAVVVVGIIFFKEPLSTRNIIALVLIITGIFVLNSK